MFSPYRLAVLPLLALLASGCSAFDDPADDGVVNVAAAFYPLAYVSQKVAAGTGAEVRLLTQPGKEPHDLELSVRQTGFIAEADLVVFEHGFQPAVDASVEQNAGGATLDAAKVVDLIPVDESAGEHEDHAEEHGHDHGDLDPHFWQDPLRMADLTDSVATELADIDPDHADAYRANAAALRTELETLDASYRTGLADCARDVVVTSHDAFGYLERYGLHIHSVVGLSPDAEPSPAQRGELEKLIRTEGITTVFSEPLEPALSAGLAHDLHLSNAELDPIEGLTEATAKEDYLSLMKSNLQALRKANDCR